MDSNNQFTSHNVPHNLLIISSADAILDLKVVNFSNNNILI